MSKKLYISKIRSTDGSFELPEGAVILGYEVRNEIMQYQQLDGTRIMGGGDRFYITIASPKSEQK